MAIDLREIEPLGSKSVLLEQAMRRQRATKGTDSYGDIDMSDMISPDFAWLNEDKEAIQGLVRQMDATITMLANQVKVTEDQGRKSRQSMEKEQQLMFKQIRTLNDLLKKQVELFSSVERQMDEIELKQHNLMPQVGVGLIAGLMSAVTILATAPWLTVLVENIR
ncbi:MAG: spore germination protein PC [Thiomicrorhabdus sp.]|nr:MAG: spore germination protein PC [Thiomicrorhabdus sp.]